MGYIIRNGIKYFGDNAVELTQAQYDALPSSKLTDGVDYYITDAQAGAPLATEIAMSTSDNGSVAEAISGLSAVSRFTASGSAYGGFAWLAINGIKCVYVNDPQGLAANSLTTLDFTLPETMRPMDRIRYFDMRQPSDNYTIRFIINSNGTVQIYNYGTVTGKLNMNLTGCYI